MSATNVPLRLLARVIFVSFLLVSIVLSSFSMNFNVLNAATPIGTAPVYRFWSGSTHFYTQLPEERDLLTTDKDFKDVWGYEGAQFVTGVFDVNANKCMSGTPAYRFWSNSMQTHFYAESEEIKNLVEEQWADAWDYEKIAFCVELEQVEGTVPMYRFWSESLGKHFYTISETDMQTIKDNWSDIWAFESIVFYAYEFDKTATLQYLDELDFATQNYLNEVTPFIVEFEEIYKEFAAGRLSVPKDDFLAMHNEFTSFITSWDAEVASISLSGLPASAQNYNSQVENFLLDYELFLEDEGLSVLDFIYDEFTVGGTFGSTFVRDTVFGSSFVSNSLDSISEDTNRFIYESGITFEDFDVHMSYRYEDIFAQHPELRSLIFLLYY